MGLMSKAKFKNVDFYRKIPKDMTEGTIPGSVISMLAALVIGLLLVSEVGSYLTPKFDTRVVIDRSADGEMMRINFNVSFPALSCEFASVDVGDAMGLNRFNLTKTVFKRAIDAKLNPLGPIQWERGHENRKEPEHADDVLGRLRIGLVVAQHLSQQLQELLDRVHRRVGAARRLGLAPHALRLVEAAARERADCRADVALRPVVIAKRDCELHALEQARSRHHRDRGLRASAAPLRRPRLRAALLARRRRRRRLVLVVDRLVVERGHEELEQQRRDALTRRDRLRGRARVVARAAEDRRAALEHERVHRA